MSASRWRVGGRDGTILPGFPPSATGLLSDADQPGHLPIGHCSWAIRDLTLVKHPQMRQRMPGGCSQELQVAIRFCWRSAGVVFRPEPMYSIIALVADTAMR